MPLQLNFRSFGEGPALIILHGLYGSSDNWISIGRELASFFTVYIPDQRNHGSSPHTKEHNYKCLSEDILNFMQEHQIPSASFLGHSMGGKVAMLTALRKPEVVNKLIVVDISPRAYQTLSEHAPQAVDHLNILKSMQEVNFDEVENRMDVDMILASTIKSQRIRAFLLKNVKRTDKRKFGWKINLPVLLESLPHIMEGIIPESNQGISGSSNVPVLFLKGENSGYIPEEDFSLIKELFAHAQIVTIPNSGHWLHAEQTSLFLKNVRYFLEIDKN